VKCQLMKSCPVVGSITPQPEIYLCPWASKFLMLLIIEGSAFINSEHLFDFCHIQATEETLWGDETGPTIYIPYFRRLEGLTICR